MIYSVSSLLHGVGRRHGSGSDVTAAATRHPKRALVHELQNDLNLSRMSLLLERLDEACEHATQNVETFVHLP